MAKFRPIYFKTSYENLWQYMEPKVKALVSKNPSYQIWVTGHSLVAALASLAGAWLAYYNIAPRKNIILSLWRPQSWQLQIRPATRSVGQQPLEEGCKFWRYISSFSRTLDRTNYKIRPLSPLCGGGFQREGHHLISVHSTVHSAVSWKSSPIYSFAEYTPLIY